MALDSLTECFLGIVGRRVKGLINEAVETGASAGEQPDAGLVPNTIEIDGQGGGVHLAEGQDTVGGQPHAAHLGDILNRCCEKHRRSLHGADVRAQGGGAYTRHGSHCRCNEAKRVGTPIGDRGGIIGARQQLLQQLRALPVDRAVTGKSEVVGRHERSGANFSILRICASPKTPLQPPISSARTETANCASTTMCIAAPSSSAPPRSRRRRTFTAWRILPGSIRRAFSHTVLNWFCWEPGGAKSFPMRPFALSS